MGLSDLEIVELLVEVVDGRLELQRLGGRRGLHGLARLQELLLLLRDLGNRLGRPSWGGRGYLIIIRHHRLSESLTSSLPCAANE